MGYCLCVWLLGFIVWTNPNVSPLRHLLVCLVCFGISVLLMLRGAWLHNNFWSVPINLKIFKMRMSLYRHLKTKWQKTDDCNKTKTNQNVSTARTGPLLHASRIRWKCCIASTTDGAKDWPSRKSDPFWENPLHGQRRQNCPWMSDR